MTVIDSNVQATSASEPHTFYDTYWKVLGYFTNTDGVTMKVHFMTARSLGLEIPGACRRFGEIEDGVFSTRIEGLHPMWVWASEKLVEGLKNGQSMVVSGPEYFEFEALRSLKPALSDRYSETADQISVVAFCEKHARKLLTMNGFKERDTRL